MTRKIAHGTDWTQYADGHINHTGNGCAGICGCGEVGLGVSDDAELEGES